MDPYASDDEIVDAELIDEDEWPAGHQHFVDGVMQEHTWDECPENPANWRENGEP